MGFRRIDVVLINVTPYTVTSAGLDITNSGVTNVLTPPDLILESGEYTTFALRRPVSHYPEGSIGYAYTDSAGNTVDFSLVFSANQDGDATLHCRFGEAWGQATIYELTTRAIGDAPKAVTFYVIVSGDGQAAPLELPTVENQISAFLFVQDPLGLGAAPEDATDIIDTYLSLPTLASYSFDPSSMAYADAVISSPPADPAFDFWQASAPSDADMVTRYSLDRTSTSSFTFGFTQGFKLGYSMQVAVSLPAGIGVTQTLQTELSFGANQSKTTTESVRWTGTVELTIPAGKTATFSTTLYSVEYSTDFTASVYASVPDEALPTDEEARNRLLVCRNALMGQGFTVAGTLAGMDGTYVNTEVGLDPDQELAARRIHDRRRISQGRARAR